MTGPPLSPVRPVCEACPDGLVDGILDRLVTADCARQPARGSGQPGAVEVGVFTQRGGEAAEGAGAAGGGELVFQPGHGGGADPGPVGELFLGQPVLAAEAPQPVAIQDGEPSPTRVGGLGGGHQSCRVPAGEVCSVIAGGPASLRAMAASKRSRSLERTIHGPWPFLPRAMNTRWSSTSSVVICRWGQACESRAVCLAISAAVNSI